MASRALHDHPRMMKRSYAAAYLDMSVAEFERAMAAGVVPHPVKIADQERWSRAAIDEALDRLTGAEVPSFRSRAKFCAQN